MTDKQSETEDPGFDPTLVDPIRCEACDSNWLVSDVEFPEPEADTNTQFGWLAATCPGCRADLRVSWDRIKHVFV